MSKSMDRLFIEAVKQFQDENNNTFPEKVIIPKSWYDKLINEVLTNPFSSDKDKSDIRINYYIGIKLEPDPNINGFILVAPEVN